MSTACDRFRLGLDDDQGRELDPAEQRARAEHMLKCPDCREEMKGVVVQRATVHGVFRSDEALPPLSESLVAKCLNAMKRAARDEESRGQSTG